ncbi:hypothetical protein, partial [Mycoplasmopsis bovis]|uniref:hypothetical protein n=1 Tax=Mycoplasmopsis bovis TaxID=28903 RepID=UPI003D279DA1
NKYLVNENNRSIDQNRLESEYKKLNLGITFRGNRYKLVTLANSNNQLFWKTVYIEGIDQLGFDKGLLTKYLFNKTIFEFSLRIAFVTGFISVTSANS